MLNQEECKKLHVKNAGKTTRLDMLAINDGRIVLKNDDETLHVFMSSEWDETEQSQAARLCAAINSQRSQFKKAEADNNQQKEQTWRQEK